MIFNKKIIALIGVVFLMFSSVLPTGAEELADDYIWTTEDKTEIQTGKLLLPDTDQERHLTMLRNLGLLEGTVLAEAEIDTALTRAQYAAVVCNVFRYDEMELPKDLTFTDIPSDHQNYGAIAVLNAIGSMSGVSDTLFLPDDGLLYEDAVKVLVSMLGYEVVAQKSGGYPMGYMTVAKKIDLVNDFDRMSDFITVGDLANLFYNLLEVQPLKLTRLKNGAAYYEAAKDESFMSQYWDLYKSSGVVNAIYLSEFDDAPSVKNGEIAVDGVIYKNETEGADAYFAHSVTIYYQENASKKTKDLLHIEDEDGARILTISDDDTTYENNVYTYYDEERRRMARISPEAEIFYNGKHTKYYKELMVPNNGEVALVDYDRDGLYDAVLIKNYVTAVISSTEQDAYTVLMKKNITLYAEDDALKQETVNMLVLDPEKCNAHIYNNAFIEKSFLELGGNMVISAAVSLDKSIVEICMGTEKVVGTVSGISKKKAVIGEKEYEIVYGLLDKNQISLGVTGEFYLDFRGRIVWSVTAVNSEPLGVFLKASMSPGAWETANIMFLNAVSKEKTVYKIDDKLLIDGVSYPAENENQLKKIIHSLRRSMVIDGKEYLSYKLVYIDANSEGVLKKVYTVNSDKYENFRVVNTGEAGYEDAEVAISAATIGDRGIFNADTSFIYMPYVALENVDWLSNAENYIFFRNKWMIGNAIGKFVDFYYTDDDSYIDVLVRYGIQLKESMLSDAKNPDFILPPAIMENVGIVKYISQGVDEEGNDVTYITFIRSDGKEQKEKTNSRYSLESKEPGSIGGEQLEPGDVFSYFRAEGIIGNFCKIYDCSEASAEDAFLGVPLGYVDLYNLYPGNMIRPNKNTSTAGVYKSSFRATAGTVYEVKSDSFYIALGNSTDDSNLAVFGYKGEPIIVCDRSCDNNIYTGSLSDMRGLKYHGGEASQILAYLKDGKAVSFFIYN